MEPEWVELEVEYRCIICQICKVCILHFVLLMLQAQLWRIITFLTDTNRDLELEWAMVGMWVCVR